MQAPDAPSAKDAPITGFCRRGITTLCAGRAPADALAIIERSCSLAGGAHRLAYCLALESLTRSEAPENARIVRTLFVEVERILARLWTLGQTARAAEEYTPFQEALEQRELLLSA
ncbi:MAG TPA: nickel-dependent hydrogenase large subunit, partial [Ktedonobacterales bacterium]|nr:nickel-dependent hydrogenase large subunit [Ktedonobacterales bacterium]